MLLERNTTYMGKILMQKTKNKSIKKNYFYSLLLTLVNSIYPLITAPYISRVLGAELLGSVNFSLSTVSWFSSLASFGINNYGVREIAKARNDDEEKSKIFSELIFINAGMVIFVSIIYIICVSTIDKFMDIKPLMIIAGINLLLNVFLIDWFFQGIEEYRYITLRNIFIKIISVIIIFGCVRNKSDYYFYALASVLGVCLNNLFNFYYSSKMVKIKFQGINPKRHLKKLAVFASSNLVGSMYASFDKVLLGIFSTTSMVAFYVRSISIINVCLSLLYSLSKVITSRATYNYAQGEKQKYFKLVQKSYNGIMLLGTPMAFGLFSLSYEIMYLFGGEEFAAMHNLLRIATILIITNALANWTYNQILIPMGAEKTNLKIQLLSASVSLVVNIIFIPYYGAFASVLALILSQALNMIRGIMYARNNDIQIKLINKRTILYVISSIIMYLFIQVFKIFYSTSSIILIFVLIILSAIVYFLILLCFREPLIMSLLTSIFKYAKNQIRGE